MIPAVFSRFWRRACRRLRVSSSMRAIALSLSVRDASRAWISCSFWLEQLQAALQVAFLLAQAAFELLEILAFLTGLILELRLRRRLALLGLELDFLQADARLILGITLDLSGASARDCSAAGVPSGAPREWPQSTAKTVRTISIVCSMQASPVTDDIPGGTLRRWGGTGGLRQNPRPSDPAGV